MSAYNRVPKEKSSLSYLLNGSERPDDRIKVLSG